MGPTCGDCGEEAGHNFWQAVVGYEQRRKAGGTNAIALRANREIFLCDNCMRRRKKGLKNQGALFR